MKAPAGADTAPLHRLFTELVVSLKPPHQLRLITVCWPLVLRPLFGVRVLPEEHRFLGDDFRKHVSALARLRTSTSCLRLLEEFHMISTGRWIRILRSLLVL